LGDQKIYYYDHLPHYRAALIGQELLGVQMYVHSDSDSRSLAPGDLRLIASRYSSQFDGLKKALIDGFTQHRDVSTTPDETITFQ